MRERVVGFEPRWIQNLMIAGGSEPVPERVIRDYGICP